MQQLGELAENLLEERVRLGTASPTETVALARMNSPLEIANLQRVQAQTEYLLAQAEKARSEAVREDMFQRAMDAMSRYSPDTPDMR